MVVSGVMALEVNSELWLGWCVEGPTLALPAALAICTAPVMFGFRAP